MRIVYSDSYSTHLQQVTDGLVYISEQGLEHGSLTCSSILVSKEGTVKLGSSVTFASGIRITFFTGQCERCYPRASSKAGCKQSDVTAFESIAAQLMGGHVKPKGATSLPNLKRWCPDAATFLAHANSAMSVHELQDVSLLNAHNTETDVH
jgi:hypothetical protein